MAKKPLPLLYLGNVNNCSSQKDYFEIIKDFLSRIDNIKSVIIVKPNLEDTKSIKLVSNPDNAKNINKLNQVIKDNSNQEVKISHEPDLQKKNCMITELNLPNSIVFMLIPTDRQLAMKLGKILGSLRNDNCLIIGIGNITYLKSNSVSQTTNTYTLEFDSWVRARMFEFDYYAIRDFENFYVEIQKSNFLEDERYFIPFLFLFGGFQGTDHFYDLHTGFENNNSIRSFYLSKYDVI